MKINRNYRFVLTSIAAEDFNAATAQESRTGGTMFESECHYYVEKEILSALKEAAKKNMLDDYRGRVYLIYKETKAVTQKEEQVQEDGTKITIERKLPTTATLIETIQLNGDDVDVR